MSERILTEEELNGVCGGVESDPHKGSQISDYTNLVSGTFYYLVYQDYAGKAKYSGYGTLSDSSLALCFTYNGYGHKLVPSACTFYEWKE